MFAGQQRRFDLWVVQMIGRSDVNHADGRVGQQLFKGSVNFAQAHRVRFGLRASR